MSIDILSHLSGRPVIVGAGLAGLTAALYLDQPCVVLTLSPLGTDIASGLAQGGVAAAVGEGDNPLLHAQDTLAAGAGLCVSDVVQNITQAAPDAIRILSSWGVPFARKGTAFDLHLEAAHSKKRILHTNGDGSGAALMKTMIERVKARSDITVLENVRLTKLLTEDEHIVGVQTSIGIIPTHLCIIASGGIGALYESTTSPNTLTGSALAVSARAGARLVDMEFTQFHPTALKTSGKTGRRPLVSEAVRGAGALLVDETGQQFTDELLARDVVSRAIASHIEAGHSVFLNATQLKQEKFSKLFPGITKSCHAIGINPDEDLIPVSPAMHYHMGGIEVDNKGRSSIAGLWACGEASCTGLHGANRLASNSLLEAFLTGKWVAEDVNGYTYPSQRNLKVISSVVDETQGAPLNLDLMKNAGIVRSQSGLQNVLDKVLPHILENDHALIAAFIATSALRRCESRGSHYRSDFPHRSDPFRTSITLSELVA
ncbi:L-aspartate oxidase [Swingsia samuiensis]|uniref:L-aspartate oxidase n=1 Tax=Swingsia samuiensis TaxID=1293412 RepID=A0A4Y6UNZ4_9PROT|nr:L-aspartate oxidase [Swingsia samuiensis]QDH17775.1 L-aspartate oxidase [Swingsia samuiensis]